MEDARIHAHEDAPQVDAKELMQKVLNAGLEIGADEKFWEGLIQHKEVFRHFVDQAKTQINYLNLSPAGRAFLALP